MVVLYRGDFILIWVKVPLGVHIINGVNTAGGIFSSVRELTILIVFSFC